MRPAIVKPSNAVPQGKGRGTHSGSHLVRTGIDGDGPLLSEAEFRRAIRREKGRTERSRSPFILMLVDAGPVLVERPRLLAGITQAMVLSTRDTDLVGWYATGCVLGILFTEVSQPGLARQAETLMDRARQRLATSLSPETAHRIDLSVHICPEEEAVAGSTVKPISPIHDEVEPNNREAALFVKRAIDILGASFALLLFSPILLAVAVAVKFTSKGPILFRQQRVGLRGQPFTFIKFRSMATDNDPAIHRAYVEQYIKKGAAAKTGPGGEKVYKIPHDPRVTKVGHFLRRTSLDEFPQFYNVLKGEMSLVGPRPPIPYEVNKYDEWHKRRYLSVKPGLTGLWQVHGRSRTSFDEMVRLDLLYARSWTIWGDIKILLQTPYAVIGGDGAV